MEMSMEPVDVGDVVHESWELFKHRADQSGIRLVDTDTINVNQVPGLGNIPIIGTLFKKTSTAKSTAELIFFITPRIKSMDAISVLTPGNENTTVQPQ